MCALKGAEPVAWCEGVRANGAGGFVVSVVKDLGIPVKLIGVGEKIDDLRDFQPDVFSMLSLL